MSKTNKENSLKVTIDINDLEDFLREKIKTAETNEKGKTWVECYDTVLEYLYAEHLKQTGIDVNDMRGIFMYCNELESFDLSHFDTSKDTDAKKGTTT